MSDLTTPFLGLTKPAVGGSNDTWGNKQNTDADLLDTNASAHDARIAALEARCTALEAKPSIQEAVGSIKWWPTNNGFPPGFVFCDGSWYTVTEFPLLFAVLSNTFGGDGVNNFAVPDLRGFVLVGMDEGTGRLQGQYGADRLGGIGGTATVALTLAQAPPHAHGGYTDTQGAHLHNYTAPAVQAGFYIAGGSGTQISPNVGRQTDTQGAHYHNIQTDAQGGGAAHTNCQPGMLGYFVIKAVNL